MLQNKAKEIRNSKPSFILFFVNNLNCSYAKSTILQNLKLSDFRVINNDKIRFKCSIKPPSITFEFKMYADDANSSQTLVMSDKYSIFSRN